MRLTVEEELKPMFPDIKLGWDHHITVLLPWTDSQPLHPFSSDPQA